MGRLFGVPILMFCAVNVFGQISYEKVLLPAIISTPGEHGALWNFELRGYNNSDSDLAIQVPVCTMQDGCGGVDGFLLKRVENEMSWVEPQPLDEPGLLILVPSDKSDLLSFDLRIADSSRRTTTLGTEVPVIRERDLKTGTIELMGIPTDPLFRDNLRIYAVDGQPSTVHVQYFSSGAERDYLLREGDLTLTTSSVDKPTYVAVNDFQNDPLLSDPAANETTRLRIEITPVTPGLRYWAFVSITNNETQQITLVTP